MYIKKIQYFITLNIFLSCCCCDNYDFFKIEGNNLNQNLTTVKYEELNDFFQTIKGNNDNEKGVLSLKYIGYKNITVEQLKNFTKINDYWNEEKLEKLKKQIQFATIVSYPYYIEFLLRLKKLLKSNDQRGISFFTSIGGSGRSIHYPCGYNLRRVVNEKNNDFLNVTNNDQLNEDDRQTQLPIFSENNIFTKANNNILTFFENRLGINFNDSNKQSQYNYICSVLEYLAQLGNPIFTIYGHGIRPAAVTYNIALMLKDIFKFDVNDFFGNEEYNFLDIIEADDDNARFKDNSEIIKQLEGVGASSEKNVLMLAGAITLNNLLYKIFYAVRSQQKRINCVLGFESYSGRVWEILIAIWKNNYNYFFSAKTVTIKKNELQCVLTHCLIGDNNLLPEYQIGNKEEVIINTPQILKNIINEGEGLGQDRLYYLDCDKICGCSLYEIAEFWKKLTDQPTLQIISNIVNNNGNGILNSIKHFLRYEWDHLITSYFSSPYNDGMLSDDGLFIYMGNENFENFCKNIFERYTTGENINEQTLETYEIKILKNDNKTFCIKDKSLNILYINVGYGKHLDNKRNNPYDGRVKNFADIFNI